MSGIYIHVPFCKQACHYCDFHFSTQMGKKEAMVHAIAQELELRKVEVPNTIETIARVRRLKSKSFLVEILFVNFLVSSAYIPNQLSIHLEYLPQDID